MDHAQTHPPGSAPQTDCADNIKDLKNKILAAVNGTGSVLEGYQLKEGQGAIEEEPTWQKTDPAAMTNVEVLQTVSLLIKSVIDLSEQENYHQPGKAKNLETGSRQTRPDLHNYSHNMDSGTMATQRPLSMKNNDAH